jgi:hypothetical protein
MSDQRQAQAIKIRPGDRPSHWVVLTPLGKDLLGNFTFNTSLPYKSKAAAIKAMRAYNANIN